MKRHRALFAVINAVPDAVIQKALSDFFRHLSAIMVDFEKYNQILAEQEKYIKHPAGTRVKDLIAEENEYLKSIWSEEYFEEKDYARIYEKVRIAPSIPIRYGASQPKARIFGRVVRTLVLLLGTIALPMLASQTHAMQIPIKEKVRIQAYKYMIYNKLFKNYAGINMNGVFYRFYFKTKEEAERFAKESNKTEGVDWAEVKPNPDFNEEAYDVFIRPGATQVPLIQFADEFEMQSSVRHEEEINAFWKILPPPVKEAVPKAKGDGTFERGREGKLTVCKLTYKDEKGREVKLWLGTYRESMVRMDILYPHGKGRNKWVHLSQYGGFIKFDGGQTLEDPQDPYIKQLDIVWQAFVMHLLNVWR